MPQLKTTLKNGRVLTHNVPTDFNFKSIVSGFLECNFQVGENVAFPTDQIEFVELLPSDCNPLSRFSIDELSSELEKRTGVFHSYLEPNETVEFPDGQKFTGPATILVNTD